MKSQISFKIEKSLAMLLETYLKVTQATKSKVAKAALREYYEKHPISQLPTLPVNLIKDTVCKSTDEKKPLSLYVDNDLLNRVKIFRDKLKCSTANLVEYSLLKYLDEAKSMPTDKKSAYLSNITKNKSVAIGGVDKNVYESLKEWCKNHNESMLRMTTISVLLYMENNGI